MLFSLHACGGGDEEESEFPLFGREKKQKSFGENLMPIALSFRKHCRKEYIKCNERKTLFARQT